MTDGSRLGSCVVNIIEPPVIKCALGKIRKVLIGFSVPSFLKAKYRKQTFNFYRNKLRKLENCIRFYRNSVNIQSSRVGLHAVSRTTVQHFQVTED